MGSTASCAVHTVDDVTSRHDDRTLGAGLNCWANQVTRPCELRLLVRRHGGDGVCRLYLRRRIGVVVFPLLLLLPTLLLKLRLLPKFGTLVHSLGIDARLSV